MAAPNVPLLFLPPHSPRLNPIERLWKWIKGNFLANTVFETPKALVDRLYEAWRSLTPALIRSICRADWINAQ